MSARSSRADRLHAALTRRFMPRELTISDESARHAGHAGAAPGGETHFHVRMVTDAFAGQSRLARQRAVHAAVADELASGLHALSMELHAAGEA